METDQKQLVKQLLNNEPELVLKNGENELSVESGDYFLRITYYLESNYEYFPLDSYSGHYTFNVFDVYLFNNKTNEEFLIHGIGDIEQTIKDNARVEDWSDYSFQGYFSEF